MHPLRKRHPCLPMLARKISQRIHLAIISLLVLALVVLSSLPVPALQPSTNFATPPPLLSTLSLARANTPFSRPDIKVFRSGDIEYTAIVLDGKPLFEIATPVATEGATSDMRPIQRRVQQIENTLNALLRSGFNPETLKVSVGTLNSQVVLLARDENRLPEQILLTVTDLDAQINQMRHAKLAQQWAGELQTALIEGWEERQPAVRQQRFIKAIQIALVTLMLSLVILALQKHLKRKYKRIKESVTASKESIAPEPGTRDGYFVAVPLRFLDALLPWINLERKCNVNILQRRLLQFGQAVMWVGGSVWILYLFPETRETGSWLLEVPIRILLIWLVINLANKVTDILIDFYIQAWVEHQSLTPVDTHRLALRAPTLSNVLKGLTDVAAYVGGIIWFLAWSQIPLGPFLTGAGLLGAALTFVFQNLIKDLINGTLILFEDQYAVGDVIDVGEAVGFVESMNLRVTRLRGDGGRLTTIPNSQVMTVHNLTKDWARIDLTVDVAYDTDPTQAMEIMQQTIEEMHDDPLWQPHILEPVNLLGVNRVDYSSIQILMWIKTQPIKQWDVEREFRRRLKQAFDRAGIELGMPQQSLFVQTGAGPFSSGAKQSDTGKEGMKNGSNEQLQL